MLWDIGTLPFFSKNGILTTVAFKMGPESKAHYALEGSVSFAGATINWLRNKLCLFSDYAELEKLARETYKTHQQNAQDPCYLVPAFTGLFCPWWQENARATLTGLTADVDRGAFIYAALRSSVYQTYDVLRVATLAEGTPVAGSFALTKPREIVVDGGMTNSLVLMQSLADILDMIVRRHNHSDMMTALGAAIAAALGAGIDPSGLLKLREFPPTEDQPAHYFSPTITSYQRQTMLKGWHAAVQRSLCWVTDSSPAETEDSLLSLLQNVNNLRRPSRVKNGNKAINSRILPKVISSAEVVGVIEDPACKMGPVKIAGILGDQQASLVGQTWTTTNGPADAKLTQIFANMIVRRHNHSDMMTALGAAIAAALGAGIDPSGLLKLREFPPTEDQPAHYFSPTITSYQRQTMLKGWHAAVQRSLCWVTDSSPAETEDSLLSLLQNVNNLRRPSRVKNGNKTVSDCLFFYQNKRLCFRATFCFPHLLCVCWSCEPISLFQQR
ncbi:Glycerol kinase [Fasciolopsis buskii]|uniref:Glycerol kinase n=1 Tax=Fasciolopsis buskii TaxID=27845 RepID=A0A8E0VRR5_9TREM|nr:Glycerol kinase [Fasciolopsis buski]